MHVKITRFTVIHSHADSLQCECSSANVPKPFQIQFINK